MTLAIPTPPTSSATAPRARNRLWKATEASARAASATPVEWRHGLVRADRFSYVARWSDQDLGAGFEPAALTP